MKKILMSMCLMTLMFFVSSCRSSKDAVSVADLNGEWNIVEVNGAKVVVEEGMKQPFIGFNTETGSIHGSFSCNKMMGHFDVNAKPGMLSLASLGSTRMMCPDMTLEQNIQTALSYVVSYIKRGKNHIILCNEFKRPVVVLERKSATMSVSILKGKWLIKEAMGKAIPAGLEHEAFLELDLKKGTVHGNASCNLFNGEFKLNKNNPAAISFPGLVTTMMACPDMSVEASILKGLHVASTFAPLAGGGVAFYDDAENIVIVLEKK